jgi:hypothetical protein
MRYTVNLSCFAIMLEGGTIAVGADYACRISHRVARSFLMAAHNRVGVDLFKGTVFVFAPIAFAISDFHRTQWLGCVGLAVFTADWTIQTFTPSWSVDQRDDTASNSLKSKLVYN